MRKLDFTRVLFLIISLFLVGVALILPDGNIMYGIIGALIVVTFIILDIKAPDIVKLSEENVKVKVFRSVNRLSMAIVTLVIILNMSPKMEVIFKEATQGYTGIVILVIFMMFFGNIAPIIPFNRYIGLRLPWTIRDEETWKLAHRIVGYGAFPIGILMLILAIVMNPETIAVSGIIIWILIPGVISYKFYRNKFKSI